MNQFKAMWIPCEDQEWREVIRLLFGMGYECIRDWDEMCTGVLSHNDGKFMCIMPREGVLESTTTVTLPELRIMVKVMLRKGTYSDPKPTVLPIGEDFEQLKIELHNAKAELDTYQFVAKDYSDSLTKLRDLVSLMRDAQIKGSSEKGALESEVDAYLWKLNNPF